MRTVLIASAFEFREMFQEILELFWPSKRWGKHACITLSHTLLCKSRRWYTENRFYDVPSDLRSGTLERLMSKTDKPCSTNFNHIISCIPNEKAETLAEIQIELAHVDPHSKARWKPACKTRQTICSWYLRLSLCLAYSYAYSYPRPMSVFMLLPCYAMLCCSMF